MTAFLLCSCNRVFVGAENVCKEPISTDVTTPGDLSELQMRIPVLGIPTEVAPDLAFW